MKVLASLYSFNSKTGAPVVWEFCETASGKFGATNGWSWTRCSSVEDLRRAYKKFSSYTKPDGSPRFSRTPLTATVQAASVAPALADPWVAA